MNYIGNHNHTDKGSNLRMLDCICKIKPLIDRAIELGYKGLSITDHSSVSSHIQAIQYVKELKEKGTDFTLGLGVEEYVIDDHIDIKENYVGGGVTKFWHLIFIAKNSFGYEQLRMIDSTAWDNSFKTGKMVRTPIDKQQIEEIIGDNKGNILCSTACLGSELAQHVLDYLSTNDVQYKQKIHEFITWLINTFGKENISLEIQPSYQTEQIEYNKFLMMLSEAYDIPVIITTDTHYIKKEDRGVHQAFLTSRDSEERELGDFYATTYLMTIEEMWEYVKDYMSEEYFNQIIENSYDFTKDVEFIDMEHSTIIPARDLSSINFDVKHIFKDWYNKCEGINNFAYSEFIQDKYLLYMIEIGFLEKKQEFNKENIMRINWELNELWKVSEALHDRMSAYYNLVDYIVDLCWEIGFVGVSRGCFTKDALVITKKQMKPLNLVEIGDEVLSADGNFNKVIDTLQYDIKEPLIEINYKKQGSLNKKYPNICTLDHKILIKKDDNIKYIPAKDIEIGDYVCYPKIKDCNYQNHEYTIDLQDYNIYGYKYDNNYIYEKHITNKSFKYSAHWCEKNLSGSKGFYQQLVKYGIRHSNKSRTLFLINELINNTPFKSIEEYRKYINKNKYSIKSIPRFIKIDSVFSCFIGLMLGDGWILKDKKVFGLALNNNEYNHKNNFNRYVFNKISKKFNLNNYENISINKQLTQLSINSNILTNCLGNLLFVSKKDKEKQVSDFILSQNKSNLYWIKIGLEKSDGSVNKKNNKFSFDNTSKYLISFYKQLSNLFRDNILALDVRESHTDKRNKSWINKESYKLRNCIIDNNVIEDDNYWFLPVTSTKIKNTQATTVYDLTIENNHSYTINNMCVHNSVTGYYTMYLIDMHQMNPIKWNLPAYRHLNSSRVSFPKQHWGLVVNRANGCVA